MTLDGVMAVILHYFTEIGTFCRAGSGSQLLIHDPVTHANTDSICMTHVIPQSLLTGTFSNTLLLLHNFLQLRMSYVQPHINK